jgi:hypothetical protein
MNPTQEFIAELVKLLKNHEESTGTYIRVINIQRYIEASISNQRPKSVIIDVKLDIT